MIGKMQRTDTDAVDEQFTTPTQDSVLTAFDDCHAVSQQHHQCRHQQQQSQQPQHVQQQQHHHHEETDIGSGSEVDGPVNDKYIKGTRLVVGGWFQACRCARAGSNCQASSLKDTSRLALPATR
eukprot:GHRQ01020462.1.p1 GENE.GHRQ01020462.1~~GHRQ01020462.1.p1  ORF type:complete len:124 (+),score=33.19 GHRQ01020462.1:274-645(+)